MRRILFALMSTVTAVIMLFGYRTSTASPTSVATAAVAAAGTSSTSSTSSATPTAPTAGATPSSGTGSTASSTPSAASTKTVTGQTVQTRWGPVQVQIRVVSGKVTAVTVLQEPSSNGRDVQINNAALPVLTQETLKAQNAHIDSVSGATYTSQGYIGSLQSALDQAGL